MDDDEYSNGL